MDAVLCIIIQIIYEATPHSLLLTVLGGFCVVCEEWRY